MTDEVLFSVVLGASIGGVYALTAYISFRFALGRSQKVFMIVGLGGIGIRLFIAAASIALILALIKVNQPAFLGAFFTFFVLGLVLEVVLLHRRQLLVAQSTKDLVGQDTE